MDLEQEIRELKTRLENAGRMRSRAEYEREQALQSVANAKRTLQDEFGVGSLEEAKDLLVLLRTELQQCITEVKQALEGRPS